MAETTSDGSAHDGETRRDFLYLVTGATAAAGAGLMAWPLIDSMNPAANVLALAETEIPLDGIEPGMGITVKWRGKPVFVHHRTEAAIEEARSVDVSALRDPEPDADRVQRPEWLILIGICTHLGCVPLGNKAGEPKGNFDGYFCPCHGSHYDSSGRIRQGPAPYNLEVPTYAFVEDNLIRVG